MQKYNYSRSAYMPEAEDHSVEEFVENIEYARFRHYADILCSQMDALEEAGKLDGMVQMRALGALQDSQYSGVFFQVEYYRAYMERLIETI